MSADRPKRSTAGRRMFQLLLGEDEDDFYKSTYGGFEEEEQDFDYQSEGSDSVSTDSDISIDENDDVCGDSGDDDGDGGKRKRRMVTKAYGNSANNEQRNSHSSVMDQQAKKNCDIPTVQIYQSPERKSLRNSTTLKSKQTNLRLQTRQRQAKALAHIAESKHLNMEDMRRLTQEELLAEAKITEQINLKSLEAYERLELEKKRTRVVKNVYRGAVIRFHSVSMPVLSGSDIADSEDVNVDVDDDEKVTSSPAGNTELCSRTFITFTDEHTFHGTFPSQKSQRSQQRSLCPVTRRPAKYMDPVTNTPYASVQAFRIIREAYARQLEAEEGGKMVEMS